MKTLVHILLISHLNTNIKGLQNRDKTRQDNAVPSPGGGVPGVPGLGVRLPHHDAGGRGDGGGGPRL